MKNFYFIKDCFAKFHNLEGKVWSAWLVNRLRETNNDETMLIGSKYCKWGIVDQCFAVCCTRYCLNYLTKYLVLLSLATVPKYSQMSSASTRTILPWVCQVVVFFTMCRAHFPECHDDFRRNLFIRAAMNDDEDDSIEKNVIDNDNDDGDDEKSTLTNLVQQEPLKCTERQQKEISYNFR